MAYYDSNKIVVFPSSSATTDNGKKLSEENLREIVTRITKRNYRLDSTSFIITNNSGSISISAGSANIQGYKIVTTSAITIDYPVSSGTYIIGLRLRFDSGTGNILGNVDGSNTGVDVGFFLSSVYEDDENILKLATGVLDTALTITEEDDTLYRLESALYAKEAGGILYNGNTYVIDQNLRATDDVVFGSVQTDALTYKEGDNNYLNIKSVVDNIKNIIRGLKGTTNWDDNPTETIEGLCSNKLDKNEVVDTATPNKVLKLNAQGVLPANITGSAGSAASATNATYAMYVGNQSSHYTLNQNLRSSDNVIFNGIYLGNQSTIMNIIYRDDKLSLLTAKEFGFSINGEEKISIDEDGNLTSTGNITANRSYNAVFNDYAEWYEKDNPEEEILPGDIIEINPDTGKYRICTEIDSNMVVGVCSDSYGHIIGGESLDNMEDNRKKYVPVGLSGRVYVNVEDGVNILPGQLIVSSHNGKAMTKVKTKEGTVIGKAIGYVKKIDGVRKVLIQIMLR